MVSLAPHHNHHRLSHNSQLGGWKSGVNTETYLICQNNVALSEKRLWKHTRLNFYRVPRGGGQLFTAVRGTRGPLNCVSDMSPRWSEWMTDYSSRRFYFTEAQKLPKKSFPNQEIHHLNLRIDGAKLWRITEVISLVLSQRSDLITGNGPVCISEL